jgi:F0F1-type ATP synthase membrane subunit c/vacuolar-type H+-ATPase subunit K
VTKAGERLLVISFALLVLAAIVGAAFGLGYIVGKLLL